jgi:AraC-like DNA-binding protein
MARISSVLGRSTAKAEQGARFSNCGRIPPQVGWSFPRHAHSDRQELIVVLQGRLETKIAGRTLSAKKGDILWYPRGEEHVERALGASPLEILYLGFEARVHKSVPLLQFDAQGRIEHQVRWLVEAIPSAKTPDLELASALVLSVVREYERLAQGTESALVLDVGRYVQGRLPAAITLDQLADHVGLSKFHFVRKFHAAAGQSPAAFVRKLRVEAARSLVQRTALPLRAIAAEVGFADEYHLSRVFRAVTGVTPSSLRR